MSQRGELTIEDVRARMRAAGVVIAEGRLPMVRKLLDDALRPLRAVDSREIKAVEPAVRFAPAARARDER